MWIAIVLGFLGGVLGANALPHFLTGITAREYPMVFGNSAVPNAFAGWLGLVVTGVLLYAADISDHPVPALIAIAVGILPMALFHASGRAVGRA